MIQAEEVKEKAFEGWRRYKSGRKVLIFPGQTEKAPMMAMCLSDTKEDVECNFRTMCETMLDGMAVCKLPIKSWVVYVTIAPLNEAVIKKLSAIADDHDVDVVKFVDGLEMADHVLTLSPEMREKMPKDLMDDFVEFALRVKNGAKTDGP